MPQLKTLYSGGIVLGRETLNVVNRGSRGALVAGLNEWLFDYCYARGLEPVILPPLDDWLQSHDDPTYYQLALPEHEITLWQKSELIEFK